MHFDKRIAASLLAPFAFAAACGGEAFGPTGSTGSTSTGAGSGGASARQLPCDVDAVLQANCRSCHSATPQFGAPMPLVTHEDLTAKAVSNPSKKVYELVGARTHDDQHPMPQPPNARLGASDQKILDDWIAAGAPSSSEPCSSGTGSGGGGGSGLPSCKPDIFLESKTPYTMPTNTNDVYVCYGIDVPVAQKRHITAFVPHIENTQIVHHIVLFQSSTAAPAGPTVCSLGGASGWQIVSVWAPGGKGFELPEVAGLPIEGTAHYIVQVHYNNLTHLQGEMDASGFDLCTTAELRPNDADIMAFGTFKLDVPAHGTADITCNFTSPVYAPTVHLMAAMPHMHKLGTEISTANHPGGTGAAVDLGTRNPWDFNAQFWTPLDQAVKPGDVVSTRCAWKNDGDADVHWGENTEDEMCFTFALYYPKINSAQWSWGLPSYLSKCSPTP
jgi:Copper type II ascorbate-dependent monooxygenase, N-terminal domain/Copper type II ascorbate-dependent monooxygenase, C-terminal domain